VSTHGWQRFRRVIFLSQLRLRLAGPGRGRLMATPPARVGYSKSGYEAATVGPATGRRWPARLPNWQAADPGRWWSYAPVGPTPGDAMAKLARWQRVTSVPRGYSTARRPPSGLPGQKPLRPSSSVQREGRARDCFWVQLHHSGRPNRREVLGCDSRLRPSSHRCRDARRLCRRRVLARAYRPSSHMTEGPQGLRGLAAR
jgi:hypothetical protein